MKIIPFDLVFYDYLGRDKDHTIEIYYDYQDGGDTNAKTNSLNRPDLRDPSLGAAGKEP